MTYAEAIEKYGADNVREARRMNLEDGEGARTIGIYLGFTTNQVDAMIAALDRGLS